jgi:hypothetical protein
MTRAAIAGLLGAVGMVMLGAAIPTCAQTYPPAGWQLQQRIDGEWQVLRTQRGNYATVQSDTACALDLASAAKVMPSGTVLACRKAIQPIPIQRNARGN